MKGVLVVASLSVHVETGATLFPAEGGFSSIFATIETADSTLTEALVRLANRDEGVTLRCAMLKVSGRITKHEIGGGAARFVLSVEDMTYTNPCKA